MLLFNPGGAIPGLQSCSAAIGPVSLQPNIKIFLSYLKDITPCNRAIMSIVDRMQPTNERDIAMKLVKINNTEYRMNRYPVEIKGNILEYFTPGEGHKRTKHFDIVIADLPDLRVELSWYDICKICDVWGFYVALEYVENKVCGAIAERYLDARYTMYTKIKDLLLQIEQPGEFFELLKHEYRLAFFGVYILDVLQLDLDLSRMDDKYNCIDCTYAGELCSLAGVIIRKYGLIHKEIIDRLL